ncbi:MAG: serine protease, partial [Chloroflexota bacterium]
NREHRIADTDEGAEKGRRRHSSRSTVLLHMRLTFSPRVFVRSIILFLTLLLVAVIVLSHLPAPVLRQLIFWWITRPPDPTPSPPTILAPRGELPTTTVGLMEWALNEGDRYYPVGSGFLLGLDDGTVVGVTTAHSVGDVGDPGNPLQRIALGIAGRDGFVAEFGTLYGSPGVPRTGDDMTVDYVLLKLDGTIDPNFVLTPDPRGAPQPGERVSLFSGLGDGAGGLRILEGTVQSVEPNAVWVLMDRSEYPGGLSGSPLLSQHTGQVIGMAIATAPRGDRYRIGFHPIGSIVAQAESAVGFPMIADYQRK